MGSTFKGKTLLHCHGDVAVRFHTAPVLNLVELQQQIQDRQLSSAECYEIFRTLGLDYGPAHHAIDTLFLSAGKASNPQVLAKLVIPDAVAQEQSRYVLHPSLLDAGLQSCVGLLLQTNSPESLRLALPSSLEQIEVYDSCAALMWAWVRFAPQTKKHSSIQPIDIDLCTDDGKVAVRIKGFVAREIPQQNFDGAVTQLQPKPLKSHDIPPGLGSVTLKPVWEPVAIAPQAEQSKDSPTVVFGANQTWKNQIAELDRAAVVVDSAKPQSVEEFSKQLELLGSIHRLLWLAPVPIKYALDDDRLVDEQESGVLQLFRLLKSLFESGYGKKTLALTVVTSQSVAVRPFETANPTTASIHGLVATLKSEYPHWRVRLLDIDGDELPSLGELFANNDTTDFPLIARRDKQWFTHKLIPIAFENNDFPAYKQKGVYVVIGGAGGVGEVWSRHIIENYQAQVIWIGRRELDDQIRQKQAKLAAFGSKPLYIQADARNKASLAKALDEIRQSYSCINGVVHSAIELQDQSLAQMSIARFQTGLLAKAETSVRLVQVFQHEPLDFVVFFSSLISFGESPGQANYAAGCTFLDAYAQQLGKEWAVSVKVMNWGYWGNTGVVADATYRERMRQNGIGSIESQQAMAALNRLLQGQIDQLAFINLLKPQALEFVIEDEVLSVIGFARSQAHPVVENVTPEIRYSQQLQLIRTHRTDARDALLQNLLLANLSEMGVLNSSQGRLTFTYYQKWLDESIRLLQHNGLLIPQQNVSSLAELWTTWQKARLDWEGSASMTAEIELVERCLRSLPDILSGRKLPQDVIFPESSLRLVEPLYRGNPIADFFNEVIADAVVDAINSLDKGNGSIRILEVGAGTGGTTVGLLQKLQPDSDRISEYCYTDISQAFLIHAQEHYAIDYPFLKVDRFNVEQPLSIQSIQPGSYDIVVATNVLHATKNIRQTVRNIKAAMRAGGQIFINEISGNSLFSHLTFGLLEGWWRFEDAEIRIPGGPALNSHAWKQILQEEGFDTVKFPVEFAHDLGHQIVVATSNGVIRQPLLSKPHIEPESFPQTQLDDSSNVQINSVVSLQEQTTEFVRHTLSQATRTPANKIRLDTPFEQYGVDSIVQVGLIQKLEQVTGSLPNTILFEYSTTRELVDYLLAHRQEFLTASFPTRIDETQPTSSKDAPPPKVSPQPAQNPIASDTANAKQNASRFVQDDIAIVGIAGRYPGAKNLDELWEVLRTGRSCIVEADRFRRWNLSEDRHFGTLGRSHFGGFLDDVYCFDRQLFGISEERAMAMPPEVRLFLEITWETLEAAGYSRAALKQFQLREKKGIGVFVGSMYSQYAWTNPSRNEAVLSSNGTEWQIANQVSHFFDFTGPSLVLNTACSSSMTAIHLACESLRQGSCSMALAGGVNLTLEPSKFLSLERSNFLGSGQHSRSLGDGDGMIPSEGVAALLLKPLSLAIADNDRIAGIIKSSFVNHSGGRQAFTAPDPAQQTQLVLDSIARSGCDIETITYVESAANGSSLGDPIEIIALKNAFAKLTHKTGFCAIGSVKSNLGHLEAASGISQIAKVLLQFQHKTLVPTINATPRNPRIKLENSPFYLQEQLSPWVPQSNSHNSDLPRRSLINSFGAGGSYANLIVEEYQQQPSNTTFRPDTSETLLVFAAATYKGLQSYLIRLHAYLREHPAISVADLAAALQLRDCNLEYRLAAIASSTNQALNVVEQLTRHNVDVSNSGIYTSFGSADLPMPKDAQLQSAIDDRDLFRLARYWAAGADIDFSRLNPVDRKSCVVLPGYAFEHDKEFSYIIHDSQEDTQATAESSVSQTSRVMTATYLYDEPFLQDHTLLGDRVLLGVTHASLAITDFFQRFPHQRAICLKRLTFVQPIIVDRGEAVTVEIHTSEIPTGLSFDARYRTTSKQLTQTAATGHLQPDLYKEEYLDVERLLESCTPISNVESIYHTVPAIRLGSSFRTIEKLFRTSDGIIARVCLTEQSRQESHTYALHPLAINSAFLAAAPLLADAIGNDCNYLPFGIKEIYCVKVDNWRSLDGCWVYTRLIKNSGELILFDADIISDNSLVVARLRGCSLKLLHERKEPQQTSPESPKSDSIDASILETNLAADVLRYLIDKINITAQISIDETQVNTNLMQLGLGSTELVAMAASIEQDTGLEINATLFFEYPSLMEVTNFFLDSHAAAFLQLLGKRKTQHVTTPEKSDRSSHEKLSANLHGDIAVIGMHATYAECEDLDGFWQLIRDGRDVIREVPRHRWDYRPWFDPNPGSEDKTYCKWGSFIKDADKFDAAFFNISPREAIWMDPQNRLLMQSMYAAAEDAGVVNQLRGSHTGVFAGICFDDYAEKIVELGLPLDIYTGTGRSGISANRISFWFDFKGPSMVINTACSSSLVALHYACQALRNKECEMAFVGGANLLLSSLHYRYFSKLGALSPTGHCHTFDAAADGYVPAECIASILLKPLEQAEKDGDRIHAVIKGSAFAHGGYTPSLSAPSVAGEENVIVKAWEDAGIDPETLTYIEAHGTGTKLGDPIETNSLKNAFARYTSKTGFCAIGSVKANIGHAEGAAGITGLIKVILQLKHRQIPPLANLQQLNPYLKLAGSPLYINRELTDWESVGLRRAGVSSFGFSGAFAHAVVEEYRSCTEKAYEFSGPFPIVISAKNNECLKSQVANLLAFLEENWSKNLQDEENFLANLSYTLQVGREAMQTRLGFVVESIAELRNKLQMAGKDSDTKSGLFYGDSKSGKEYLANLLANRDVSEAMAGWINNCEYAALVDGWTKGITVDWSKLYTKGFPQRISLPTYAFARESYWICPLDGDEEELKPAQSDLGKLYALVQCWDAIPFLKANQPFSDRTQQTLIIGVDAKLKDDLRTCFHHASYFGNMAKERIESLKGRLTDSPWQHIIIVVPEDNCSLLDDGAVLSAQENGILAVFRIVKSLLSAGYATKNLALTLITTQIAAINQDESSNPVHSAVHGFAGVLAKEFPSWNVRVLDLQKGRSLASVDLEHFPDHSAGKIFAWRDGEWYRQTPIPMRNVPTPQADEFHSAYKNRGVYVIIGGAGGIGSAWSRFVMENYDAKVIWIGRRQIDDEIRQKIDTLKQIGQTPEYLQADASNRESLTQAYKSIKSRYSQIHGVIHSAVGQFDQSLSEMDENRFCSILSSKIDVSVNMASVFKHEPLDFMLFFSSIISLTRGGGMSGYAAGCAFKDSLAIELNRCLPFPVKVINWGYWNVGTGNTIPDATKIRMKQCGIEPIAPPQGLEALEAFLVNPLHQIALLKTTRLDRLDLVKDDEWLDIYPSVNPSFFESALKQIPRHSDGVAAIAKQYLEPIAAIETLLVKLLHGTLTSLDLLHPRATLSPALPEFYQLWLQESRRLAIALIPDGVQGNLADIWDEWNRQKIDWDSMPHIQSIVTLVDVCMRELPAILKAQKRATDIMFPNGSMSLVEGIYEKNAIATYFNELLAQTVVSYLQERCLVDGLTPIRILEIGAGTGATTTTVLHHLEPFGNLVGEYLYTDISPAFLVRAEKHLASKYPFLRTQLFDVNQPLSKQGIAIGSFDLVIATNCIHATANIRRSLRNAKAALRGGGVIFLNEITQTSLISHLTFGLLAGWWLAEDSELRVPGSPFLLAEDWKRVLQQEGFQAIAYPAPLANSLGQQVIVAVSDGVVRQPESIFSVPDAKQQPLNKEGAASANTVLGKGKGERGKILNTSFTHYPLTFSQTTRKVHSADANRIAASALKELKEQGTTYFKQLIGEVLMMDGNRIDSSEPLAVYGVDSIIIAQLTNALNKHFEGVKPGLLFEASTIDALVNHFAETQQTNFAKLLKLQDHPAPKAAIPESTANKQQPSRDFAAKTIALHQSRDSITDAIAVIGMSGRFPQAKTLTEFWENLQSGRDCITDLPDNRWNMDGFFEADPKMAREQGKSYCKWGAFLEDFDAFDPLFFNISPREAAQMDPQARIFLQECWRAFEDAGYSPSGLDDAVRERTGVYGAVTKVGFNTSFAAMVNRVSHAMDLQGASVAVDTMCSSALVALHQACEGLRRGDLQMAIVGAVNLYLDPRNYKYLCEVGLLAESKMPKVFGAGGTGFVPGEGVGAVVLKRLEDARRDNDSIVAVIRSSAVNHSGRANAYGAPNPLRQAEVISQALDRGGIDPRSVGYIESAAMGLEMADSLELNALKKVFGDRSEDRWQCYRLGSLKSSIGHGESVSGMAQFMKVVLQLKHRKLCPTKVVTPLNPDIDFASLPFQLQTELEPWSPLTIDGICLPRRAGITALGSGGVNAHLIVEEYQPQPSEETLKLAQDSPQIIILSAKNDERRQAQISQLVEFLHRNRDVSLADLAFTLQVGREAMASRAALVVNSIEELRSGLTHLLIHTKGNLSSSIPVYVGNISETDNSWQTLLAGGADAMVLQLFLEQRNYQKLAQFWVQGGKIPWVSLWEEKQVQRISLPTYPFEKRCFWEVASSINSNISLAKNTFARVGKREKVNGSTSSPTGEGDNTKPLPFPPSPFPDLCKKSNEAKFNGAIAQGNSNPNDASCSVQEIVTAIVAKSIGLSESEITPHLSLWQLGVDSIRSMEIVRRLQKRLHVDIGHRELADYGTVEALCRLIEQKQAAIALNVTPETKSVSQPETTSKVVASTFPLSEGQRGLWLLHQLVPDMTAYNVPVTLQFDGLVNVNAIKQAASFLLERHPILRSQFHTDDKGNPIQTINPHTEFFFEDGDRNFVTDAVLQEQLRAAAHRVFNLESDRLVRLHLFHQSQNRHQLLIVIHHLVVDGSSLPILLHDFLHAYAAFSKKSQPAIASPESADYADFVAWEQAFICSERGKASLSYWQKQLSGTLPLLALPFDRERPPSQTYAGTTISSKLESNTTHQLRCLAKNQNVSLFVLLLGIYQALLARYTLQNDIIVGVASAGRPEERFANTVGYFINMVPIRTQINVKEPFAQLLQRLKITVADGLDRGYFPFPKQVSELCISRDLAHSPVFQTSFAMQSFWRPEIEQTLQNQLEGVSVVAGPSPAGEIELRLEIVEQCNEILVNMAYNTDLFEQATIIRLAEHFGNLVKAVCQNPNQPIHSLELLSNKEQTKLLNKCSIGDRVPKKADDLQKCVHHLFEIQAQKTPEAVAVIHNQRSLTYAELHRQSAGLANRLRDMGVLPGTIVSIFTERSISQVVAILAVLKAGAAYLPLDPAYPQQRLTFVIEDAEPMVILTEEKLREQLINLLGSEKQKLPILYIEQGEVPQEIPPSPLLPANSLVYVIYTSGSTGQPKGVAMGHGAVMNLIQWQISQAGECQTPRTLQFASLNFDVSFQEIFSTLGGGGSLVLIDENLRTNPAELAKLIEDRQIQRLYLPYVALSSLAEQLRISKRSLPTLREVIIAGEALRITPAISQMFQNAPQCILQNQYGPSESHVVTSFTLEQDVNSWSVLPPIGCPIPGVAIYILDEHYNLMPIGIAGEIFIGGECLAQGYLNNPELTERKFVTNPFVSPPEGSVRERIYATGDVGRYLPDGNIEYLGRRDNQVKIRGFRIEPGEIEAVLETHPQVRSTVVIAEADNPNFKRLIAYIVPQVHPPITSELRSFLKQKLPDYMVPSAFVFLKALPVNPNGKVDRRALPKPEPTLLDEANYVMPKTEVEKIIAEVWQKALQVEKVGICDNFFELGGHSLLLVQINQQLQTALSSELSILDMFKYPTIQTLSQYLSGKLPQQDTSEKNNPRNQIHSDIKALKNRQLELRRQHRSRNQE
ncbi:amino acid adenylation domain-containing protein [Nostoc sp. 2RC]|uniref:amino acid adenylation domain-containing protein n=1 Tax=Nostoc sp. 2RC TaxID=2485484 RepID=UPI0037C60268